MADLDVDALCAELDDILDQPASSSTNNKRGSYQSKAQPQSEAIQTLKGNRQPQIESFDLSLTGISIWFDAS